MFPQAEVCDLLEGVGTLWADEDLFIAGRQVSEAVCMVRSHWSQMIRGPRPVPWSQISQCSLPLPPRNLRMGMRNWSPVCIKEST
jgi:hypothetical protein